MSKFKADFLIQLEDEGDDPTIALEKMVKRIRTMGGNPVEMKGYTETPMQLFEIIFTTRMRVIAEDLGRGIDAARWAYEWLTPTEEAAFEKIEADMEPNPHGSRIVSMAFESSPTDTMRLPDAMMDEYTQEAE